MRRVVLIAALALVASPVVAHADVDAWTKEHSRQFQERWRNDPTAGASAQWRAAYCRFCKEGVMHDFEVGVFPRDYTIEAMDRCNTL